MLKKWLDHLEKTQFVFPVLSGTAQPTFREHNFFRPALIQPVNSFSSDKLNNSIANITAWCHLSSGTEELSPPSSVHAFEYFSKTALLITFNVPIQDHIGLIQRLYEPHFQHVIFCSDFTKYFEAGHPLIDIKKFSYIHLNAWENKDGYFQYFCVLRAIEMNLNIEGLVVAGDDTLINHWNTFDMQQFHLSHVARSRSWWDHPWGITNALNHALIDLEARRMGISNIIDPNGSAEHFNKMVIQHWEELISMFGKLDWVALLDITVLYTP